MRVIILFVAVVIFTACHTLIDPDLPQMENISTINAILQEGESIQVQLTQAGKIDTLPLLAIDNATVQLFVNGEFAEELSYAGDAFFSSQTVVEAGKNYLCKVAIPGSDTLTGEDRIPNPEKIIGIKHINIAGKDEEGASYPALQITFSNTPGEVKYYELQMKLFGYRGDVRFPNILNIADPVLLNEGMPILLFSNETITDSVYTMHINYNTGGANWTQNSGWRATLFPLVVELRTVSYNYYRFRKQYYLYLNGLEADGVIESKTASPLFSNVENGLGIFAGYSSVLSDTIKPEPYAW